MFKPFAALATLALVLPASAAPQLFEIVNPTERMVQVPGLENLGPSRISTVEYCAEIENLDWQNLITDSDFYQMEGCLIENT